MIRGVDPQSVGSWGGKIPFPKLRTIMWDNQIIHHSSPIFPPSQSYTQIYVNACAHMRVVCVCVCVCARVRGGWVLYRSLNEPRVQIQDNIRLVVERACVLARVRACLEPHVNSPYISNRARSSRCHKTDKKIRTTQT